MERRTGQKSQERKGRELTSKMPMQYSLGPIPPTANRTELRFSSQLRFTLAAGAFHTRKVGISRLKGYSLQTSVCFAPSRPWQERKTKVNDSKWTAALGSSGGRSCLVWSVRMAPGKTAAKPGAIPLALGTARLGCPCRRATRDVRYHASRDQAGSPIEIDIPASAGCPSEPWPVRRHRPNEAFSHSHKATTSG
jgi:hypothetical protein